MGGSTLVCRIWAASSPLAIQCLPTLKLLYFKVGSGGLVRQGISWGGGGGGGGVFQTFCVDNMLENGVT